MTKRHLKCWPFFFHLVADGSKTFEIRRGEFKRGEILVMDEYDPEPNHYSGNECDVEVLSVFPLRVIFEMLAGPWGVDPKAIPEDMVIMSIKRVRP